jgi:hypothetical protein
MPGRDYIGSFTPSNQGTLGAYGQALSGGAAGLSPNTFNSTFGSGCPTSSGCIPIPGAWVPPWSVQGSLTWTISLSDADPNDGFFTEGQIYDGDSNPNNGVRYETYLTNPNVYDFSSNAVVTYGWPIDGKFCDEQSTALQQTYPKLNIVSFEVETYLNGSLLVSGCPDSYYNLYGELQNSPTGGLVEISGVAYVNCDWETVT